MRLTFMWLFAVFFATLLQSQGADNLARPKLDFPKSQLESPKSKATEKSTLSAMHLRQTYIHYCTHCHGMDGRPTSLVEKIMPEIPNFSRFDWDDLDRKDVMESIADGVGQMPGFSKILTKPELEAMAVLIKKFPSGKSFSFIEKSNRYRKADASLAEKFASVVGKRREVRVGSTDSAEAAEPQ